MNQSELNNLPTRFISAKTGCLQWWMQNFPEEGALTAKVGAPTYYFAQFNPKLHENKRIWTQMGRARPWRPLRSANGLDATLVADGYLSISKTIEVFLMRFRRILQNLK